ncbi:MAG TPA: ABC transporter substrate-binding protein, partial [Acidimicrobiales bacterium]|nr:ABC transporter substrate-binding protein [Acidimicrobiales bacterium]
MNRHRPRASAGLRRRRPAPWSQSDARRKGRHLGTTGRAVAGVALVTLLGAGCGGGDSASDSSGPGPERADKLTISLARDWGPLNLFVGADEKLAELVYDKLLAPNPYVDKPAAWLAEEVVQVDPSTWEVTLREGVRWHDGKPLTPNDVRFTFEYMKAAPTGRWTHHVSDIPTIDKVEAVDGGRVRFTCAFACPD